MSSPSLVLTDFLVTPPAYAGEPEPVLPTNQDLLGASASGPSLEASAGYYQVNESSPVHYDDQAFGSLHSHQTHVRTEAWFSWPQSGLPLSLLPYGSETEPHGTGEQLVTPTAEGHARRSRGRPICGYCHKSFGRTQELKRHERDIHSPPRQCPFCSAKWTRPDRIKSHLMAIHKERFTPEIFREVDALRGRRLVEFLDIVIRSSYSSRSRQLRLGVVGRGSCLNGE